MKYTATVYDEAGIALFTAEVRDGEAANPEEARTILTERHSAFGNIQVVVDPTGLELLDELDRVEATIARLGGERDPSRGLITVRNRRGTLYVTARAWDGLAGGWWVNLGRLTPNNCGSIYSNAMMRDLLRRHRAKGNRITVEAGA